MSVKRLKICLRRWAWLITTVIGSVCAWRFGWIVCDNFMHGFTRLPQLIVTLIVTWAMVLVTEWLGKNEIS